MARIIALAYNWWSIFRRLAVPDKHIEAIKSRPQFLNGIGLMTQSSRKISLKISSHHAKANYIEKILMKISGFMHWIKSNAEQLKEFGVYRMILSIAFNIFLKERPLKIPIALVYQ